MENNSENRKMFLDIVNDKESIINMINNSSNDDIVYFFKNYDVKSNNVIDILKVKLPLDDLLDILKHTLSQSKPNFFITHNFASIKDERFLDLLIELNNDKINRIIASHDINKYTKRLIDTDEIDYRLLIKICECCTDFGLLKRVYHTFKMSRQNLLEFNKNEKIFDYIFHSTDNLNYKETICVKYPEKYIHKFKGFESKMIFLDSIIHCKTLERLEYLINNNPYSVTEEFIECKRKELIVENLNIIEIG